MAALTAEPFAGNVRVVAKIGISGRVLEGDGSRYAAVTFCTVLLGGHTKGFFAVMAGTAR